MATETSTMTAKRETPLTHEELQNICKNVEMRRSWLPVTGGILAIVAGYLNILTGVLMAAGSPTFAGLGGFVGAGIGFGIALMVLGVISLIGGANSVRARSWRWGLAGSITALFPSLVMALGVLSLIFTTLGRPEYHKR